MDMEQRISKAETKIAVLQNNLEGLKESMKANDQKTDDIHNNVLTITHSLTSIDKKLDSKDAKNWKLITMGIGAILTIVTAYFIGTMGT